MTNPLLSPSPLPFGLPPFAGIEVAHYAEAVDAGLAEHLDEIRAITGQAEAATFENTAVAMERAGASSNAPRRRFSRLSRRTQRMPSGNWRPAFRRSSRPTRTPST